MRKTRFTRFLCLTLALLCLVSSTVLAVSADSGSGHSNTTDKSINDYQQTLETISYDEYQALYFKGVTKATEATVLPMTDNWVFRNGGITITMTDGVWKMTDSDGTVYTSADAAAEAGHEKSDLAYVDSFDGVTAVYTPSVGTMTWKVSLTEKNIRSAMLFNLSLQYYPIASKPSAVEREFYINGEAPFSEARSLSLSKMWSSYQQGGTSSDKREMVGTYRLGKDDTLEAVVRDAEDAGFVSGKTYTVSDDRSSVSVIYPKVFTVKINAFLEKYGIRFFGTDADNNEIRPSQLQTPEWMEYLFHDSEGFSHTYAASASEIYASENFGFLIGPDADGNLEFSLKSVNEPAVFSSLTLLPYTSAPSYEDYRKDIVSKVGDAQGKSILKLEAEYTRHTSTNVVYPVEDRTSANSSPVDTTRTVLNTIGTEKWETAGQWVEYTFSVDSSGFYDVYSRFRQSYLDGMYVNRSLQLFTEGDRADYVSRNGNDAGYYDGLPFAEAAKLRYNYGTGWQVTKLASEGGENVPTYQLYLRAGEVYTLRLEVTLGSMSEQVQKIRAILNALNDDYLAIIKLTGTSPDDYRDYSFTRLLPDTMIDFFTQKAALNEVSAFLKNTAGVASTYSGTCDKLSALLDRMGLDENEIAKNLETFKSYVGSLGTFLTDAMTQPLQLDYLMIQPADAEAPKGAAGFFRTLWHELKSFIQSFFRDYNSMGAMESANGAGETINVWVPYGRDQANVLRNLSTNGFTQQTNIAVDLKLVNGGTLLPSILAGMGPDVYLGLGHETVINYAIRGALLNIETMEHDSVKDFEREMLKDFNAAALNVLGIADADNEMHYYGLPETQGFSMMFVRLDVLYNLGIEIPKTWEEIYVAQSKLESNNMKIGVTTDYKIFLYQMGGDLWADNGMRINLDSTMGLAAFEKMCGMFTQYSFPYQYEAANRFRTGEMPIIIASYTALYNQLKVFATELDGNWTFVPMPGWETVNEDGTTTINNSSISAVSAVVMVDGVKKRDAAWEYMKWYTGAEAQSSYANEMVAIIGDSAKHSTANREALKSMPWTHDEYVEVSKQFENLASVNNYPGYYYIDRYTNFAFLAAYNDDANPTTKLLSYINTINNEITRKRAEFGLETLEIGQTLAKKRMDQATAALKLLEDNHKKDAYTAAIELAKYGIANQKVAQLREASEQFMTLLKGEWDGSTRTITKVSGKTAEMPSYYVNVSKQTMETKSGGYRIEDLNLQELLYFISECLGDAADALASY